MRRRVVLLLAASLAVLSACHSGSGARPDADSGTPPEPCTPAWNQWVENQLPTGDGAGHGPDVGSDEWQSVVEFRLGVRGKAQVPARGTLAWCNFVQRLLAS